MIEKPIEPHIKVVATIVGFGIKYDDGIVVTHETPVYDEELNEQIQEIISKKYDLGELFARKKALKHNKNV